MFENVQIKSRSCDRLSDVEKSIKLIHGRYDIDIAKDEPIVLCVVKDGENYIQYFVNHYRSLGIRYFVFLDNGSNDNTINILKEIENVIVFSSKLNFMENENLFRQFLIKSYGKRRWSFNVDIDELFDYPYSDVISLPFLLKYLTQNKYTIMITQVLELFTNRALDEMGEDEINNISLYRYYDLSAIHKSSYKEFCNYIMTSRNKTVPIFNMENPNILFFRGGIRKILFDWNYWLTKAPLLYYDDKLKPLLNPHISENGMIADITGVVYHYNFMGKFKEKIIERAKLFNETIAGYSWVAEALKSEKSLNFYSKTSKKLKNVNQLLNDDFLNITSKYVEFVNKNKIQ